MAKKQKKRKDDKSDWAIPAGLFIGIGVGLLIGQVAALTLIGLGAGFLITYLTPKKQEEIECNKF